jgi:hypothetical protein
MLARVRGPRAVRTVRCACAGLCLTATIIGCGSANRGLTRNALIAKADAICSRIDAEAAAASSRIHVRHTPDGPRQAFIQAATATLPISDRGLAQLRVLEPTSSLRADWNRFLEDVRKENAAGHALLQDARSLNTIAAAEVQQTLRGAQLDLESVSTKDGFSVCGKAAHA